MAPTRINRTLSSLKIDVKFCGANFVLVFIKHVGD